MRKLAFLLLVFCSLAYAGKPGVVPLNSKKAHLQVRLDSPPVLKFYRDKKFGGKTEIELDERGLLLEGALVCSWPGGKFDAKQSANMVLGYSDLGFLTGKKSDYRACPSEIPIRSTWGDGGTGAAALYVEVEEVGKELATLEFRGKPLYLNLKDLNGKFSMLPPGPANQAGD